MSDKEVRIRITGDASDLLKKLEAIKDSFDDLGKNNSSNKFMNNLTDEMSDGIKKLEQLKDGVEDVADATKKIGKNNGLSDTADEISDMSKKMESATDNVKEYNKQISNIDNNSLKDTSKHITDIADAGEQMKDTLKDVGDIAGNMGDLKFEFIDNANPDTFLNDITSGIISGAAAGKMMSNSMQGIADDIREISRVSTNIISSNAPLEEKIKYYDKLVDNIERATKEVDEYTKTEKALDDLNKQTPKFMDDYTEKLKEYLDINKQIQDVESQLDSDDTFKEKLNKIKDFCDYAEKQLGLEEKLDDLRKKRSESEKELEKYRDQERQAIETLDHQAKQYEMLVKQISKLNKEEKANVLVKEKMLKMLDETAKALNEMGANVERIPEGVFKKLSKEAKEFVNQLKDMDKHVSFDYLTKDLDQLGKSIDDKTSKLIRYRETNDSLSSTSKKRLNDLEKEAAAIKEFADNAGFVVETLEKEGQVIRKITADHEKLNDALSPRYVEEYANAMNEYLLLVNETGGKISNRFMKDDGSFDISKYIDDYIEFGKPLNQLTMQYNALKTAALEYLKLEDKSIDDKARVVKSVNEYAEALRKLKASVEDISRADIEGFDKTLASKLDNIHKVFKDENLPKTIEEFKESLSAVFDEFNNLEFGKGLDLLKDVGKGFAQNIFAKLPTQAKVAVAAIAGVTLALNKAYEAGKQQFFEGLSGAANKLRPVIDMLQNFGQEVVAAFEEITNTDLDFSSLMALGPNFEYQMQKVGAIAGSTDKQLVQLTKTAEELGGKTQFSASQVGEAFEYMAMAGYSTEEMLSSIDGVLNLAIASGTDLASTTDIVTDYMTAMGMEASNTGEFVDKLAATITSSNTTVELFGNSMKQVGSQAGMLGISMTDVSTAIGLAANAGVKGAKSGTALKNLLANMAAPTEKQAAALQKLGFSLNETGTYFELTKDGAVDLEATMKKLMTATKDMDGAQKAALITAIAGKEAMPGILAILNQGEEAWTELSSTIENSTGKVQYWNECMTLAGKSGKGATALIDEMKKVFEETESAALELGLSTEELSHAIAILGDDGKVSAENVQDLFEVIKSMNEATGETEKLWRDLDGSILSDVNKGWDYDGTIANIIADTQGLTQAEKEGLKTRLEGIESYEEAKKVAREYGEEINRQRGTHLDLTGLIEENSFATMSYADKLEYLRDNYKELGEEAFKAKMEELGLGDSMDELREICEMSDEEFEAYTHNLETVQGMAEQLAEAMDETTKASFLNLASAIENVAIGAFNALKPAIKGASDALCDFFDEWHNGDKNVFTFDGLERGLAGLADKIRGQKENIANAVTGLFEGISTFVNGGSLDSILDMGTSIVTGICEGIMKAKDNGSIDDAINGFIEKACNWIKTNGKQIEEAGKTLIDSIAEGIKNNESAIEEALETVMDIITSWIDSSENLKAQGGKFADEFIKFALDKLWIGVKNWVKEKFSAFTDLFELGNLFGGGPGLGIITEICESLFGVNPLKEMQRWVEDKFGGFDLLGTIKEAIFGNKTTGKAEDSGNSPLKFDELLGDIGDTIDKIKKFGSDLYEAFTGIDDKVKEAGKDIGNSIKTFFTKTLPEFFNPSNLGSMLGEGIGNLWNGIKEAFDSYNDFDSLIGDWSKKLGDAIKKAWNDFLNFDDTDSYKSLETSVGNAVEGASDVVEGKFKDLGKKIKDAWNDFWNFDDTDIYKSLETAIDDAVHNASVAIQNGFKGIGENLKQAWEDFCNIDESFGEWAENLGQSIKQWWEDFKQSFTDSFEETTGIDLDISKMFGDWHPIEDIKNWIKDKFGDFNLIQAIKDFLFKDGGKSGAGTPATTAMITPANIFGDWDPIGKIKEWIQSKFGNFNLIQTIKDALKKGGTTSKGADSGSEPIKISDLFGNWDPIGKIKEFIGSKLKGFNIFKCIKDYLFGETYAAEVGGGSGGGKSDIKPEQIVKIPSLGDIKEYISSKFKGFNITKFIKDTLFNKQGNSGGSGGKSDIKPEQLVNIPSLEDIKSWIGSKFKGFNIREHIKTLLLGGAGAVGGAIGGAAQLAIKAADIFGEWNPIEDMKSWLDEKIGDWSITKWIKEKMGGGKDGEGAGKIDAGELLQIDTEKLGQIEQQLQTLSTTATTTATNVSTAFTGITDSARTSFVNLTNIVRNQMLNMSNIISNQVLNARNAFTTQFLSMAAVARTQMVNVSNIIRNQAVSWSNVIRNQVTNARNAFTSQFISMASVARTQMVNVSNIVRNQAVSWSNIIRNQVTNARNALTSQMLSMAAVTRTQMVNISNIVRNQMVNCTNIVRNQGSNMASALSSSLSRLSSSVASSMSRVVATVRSYISQIKALCSQTFTMNFKANISKTVTTTNVTKSVTKGIQSAVASINRNSFALAAPQATPIGGSIGSNPANNVTGNASLTVNAPLYLDGREIARATAKYNEAELNKLSKRNSRKRGE